MKLKLESIVDGKTNIMSIKLRVDLSLLTSILNV